MAKPAINSFLEWKQTKNGLLISGMVELIIAYIFGSLAIDSGSYWHYLLAIVFFAGFLYSLFRAVKHHDKH